MKNYKLFIIACLTGVLLALAWPSYGFAPLLFIAFVPILWVENYISNNKSKLSKYVVFKYSFVSFFIFNIITSYWICFATLFGLVAPILNALLGALVFQIYHITKKSLFDNKKGFLILPLLWISMEYLHLHWELTWPWMTLGNGFSTMPMLIQWYEYTGVFGGTFLIFIVNYFAYRAIKEICFHKETGKLKIVDKKRFIFNISYFASLIIVPIIISLIILNNYKDEENQPIDVVVLQPNLEPYDNDLQLRNYEIIDLLISMSQTKTDDNTSFILAPEGCLEERLWEDHIQENVSLQRLSLFLGGYEKAQMITGSFTRKLQSEEEKDEASREIEDAPKPYYSVYNSAVHIKKDNDFEVYHKSKLVPGVERLPFKKYLGKILDFAIKLGNLPVGTLAVDNQNDFFISQSSGIKTTTPICYESVYGGFVGQKVREGAELIFIITNDSWWRDTEGYKQHASYASLRAIETRRYIARSANTGTSCFVNPKGEISQKTKFWTQDVIKASLIPQKQITFYVKYGDYIARISVFSSITILIIALVSGFLNRRKIDPKTLIIKATGLKKQKS
ncbi:MAG: apolipoprotein N-acyltransferase [Bacteroidales bacterium]|nr:apolipoprotein N-acyltransferase [Bacteroidales bacterium]